MVKKYIAYIAFSASILLLFGCSNPEAQATVSVVAYAAETDGSVPEPDTSAQAVSGISQPDGNGYYTYDYNGVQREYILYIPEGIGEGAPLIFMLHGYGGNSKDFMDFTGLNIIAEKYGFAVVYPQGIRWERSIGTCWNSGLTKRGNDDIGFLVALAKYLQQTYGFSGRHTFAAGFSNGAYMVYKLACEASDTFRAVASVAGSMSIGAWEERPISASIGILQINGTNDNAAPIRDPMSPDSDYGGTPDIKEVIEYWKSANSLDEFQEVRLSDKAAAYQYTSKQNDNLVWYVEIEGFGHDWPQVANAGFDAGEEILEFFSNFVE